MIAKADKHDQQAHAIMTEKIGTKFASKLSFFNEELYLLYFYRRPVFHNETVFGRQRHEL